MTKSPRETLSGIRGWMSLINEAIDPDQAKVDQAAADSVLEDTGDIEQAGPGDIDEPIAPIGGGDATFGDDHTSDAAPDAPIGGAGGAMFGEAKSFLDYLAIVESNEVVGDTRKVDTKPSRDDDTPGKDEPIMPGVIKETGLGENNVRGWMNTIQEAHGHDEVEADAGPQRGAIKRADDGFYVFCGHGGAGDWHGPFPTEDDAINDFIDFLNPEPNHSHQDHDHAALGGHSSIREWMNFIESINQPVLEDDGDTVSSGDGPTGETTASTDTVSTTPSAGDSGASSDAGNGNSSVGDAGAASDAGNGNGAGNSQVASPADSTPTAASPFASGGSSGSSGYDSHGVTGATPDNPSNMVGGGASSASSGYNSYGASGASPGATPTTGTLSPTAASAAPAAAPAAATPAAAPAGGDRTYTVQKGDTLSGIAKAQTGDGSQASYSKLAADSGIKNPNQIQPGQQIKIAGAAPTAAAPADGSSNGRYNRETSASTAAATGNPDSLTPAFRAEPATAPAAAAPAAPAAGAPAAGAPAAGAPAAGAPAAGGDFQPRATAEMPPAQGFERGARTSDAATPRGRAAAPSDTPRASGPPPEGSSVPKVQYEPRGAHTSDAANRFRRA